MSQTFRKYDEKIPDRIKIKLNALGISGFKIKDPIDGPVVTGYPIELSPATPIGKVLSKAEDIALSCGVDSVDIRRVGREVIVFVPNEDRRTVSFYDSLYWFLKDEKVRESYLPILLGTDFYGENAFLDLSEQPHMLIAGSTGSGKSIFEASIIASLSLFHEPEDLELYLIDTKGIDLILFSELPHVKRVVPDLESFYEVIQKLKEEVEFRNKKISARGVRNIQEFNANFPEDKLSYIVVIIDELADLIDKDRFLRSTKSKKEHKESKVTDSIRSLVQICRAAGVHFIACTQRSSVDVIDGVIQANFPARISMKLPKGVDSRVVLGEQGAEKLLGKGDMLVKFANSESLKRYHSPFIRLQDIEMVLSQRDMVLQSLNIKQLGA